MTTQLDLCVKEVARISDDEVRDFVLDAEEPLREAIMAERSPVTCPRSRRSLVRRPGPLRRGSKLAAVGLASMLGLTGALLTSGGALVSGPDSVWAATAVRVAGAVPRYVIAAPGWHVADADQFTVRDGDITFANGRSKLRLTWQPRREYHAMLAGTTESATRIADVDVHGAPATLFRLNAGHGRFFSAVWRSGNYTFNLDTWFDAGISRADFAEVLRSLTLVSVDDWLGAMPATVVLPHAHAQTAQAMLRGIPLPPGFVLPAVGAKGAVRDRYSLGADVVAAVACTWIDRWVAARESGDQSAASADANAMATSRKWPVLLEMEKQGKFPDEVWSWADRLTGNAPALHGNRGPAFEMAYGDGLGCDVLPGWMKAHHLRTQLADAP
jgi:hypothetical protein